MIKLFNAIKCIQIFILKSIKLYKTLSIRGTWLWIRWDSRSAVDKYNIISRHDAPGLSRSPDRVLNDRLWQLWKVTASLFYKSNSSTLAEIVHPHLTDPHPSLASGAAKTTDTRCVVAFGRRLLGASVAVSRGKRMTTNKISTYFSSDLANKMCSCSGCVI